MENSNCVDREREKESEKERKNERKQIFFSFLSSKKKGDFQKI
jgi:hypothetical protein